MATGESLTGSQRVRNLQTVLHAKAKEEPERRFHALYDKVWRKDFLTEAWAMARRNGGQPGVDGESFRNIEAQGVERWLGELSRVLKDGTAPQAVRQVLIPPREVPAARNTDNPGPGGANIGHARAGPIFEADLQPEQYGYRPERSAQDAVRRIHRLLNKGHNEVVDGDLANYGEIPHAEIDITLA